MLSADERCLQPDLVGADRIVPVASVIASRDFDAASSTQRTAAEIAAATNLQQYRPLVFAGLYRLAPGVLDALKIVKPETVIR
jgi:hypothetical protein